MSAVYDKGYASYEIVVALSEYQGKLVEYLGFYVNTYICELPILVAETIESAKVMSIPFTVAGHKVGMIKGIRPWSVDKMRVGLSRTELLKGRTFTVRREDMLTSETEGES